MNELSLFTGAGGGLLGTHLLGWKAIGYVEWNEYCQRVIAARIADGILPVAPIFTDVREFVQSGAAAEYRGVADVVSGGFPCQPFSVAGKQLGAADPRNMWPATIAVIRAVRPRFAFLENVPALITSGYFGTILGDLAESGYDCRWRILSAAEMGAPHLRQRVWIVAYTKDYGYSFHNGEGNSEWQGATCETEWTRLQPESGESHRSVGQRLVGQQPGTTNTTTQSTDTGSQRIQGEQPQQVCGFSRVSWGENIRSIADL